MALAAWRPLAAWLGDDIGNRLMLRGNVAQAADWFAWALRLEPGWALLHEDLGRALLPSDPKRALAEFDRAGCGAPCSAEAGDALVRMGKPTLAIDRYMSAKAVGRVSDIALSLAQRGDYTAASALIAALISRLRDKFLERAELASSYATLGKIQVLAAASRPAQARQHWRAVIAAYASASQLAPYNEGYLLSYAFAQMQWGDAAAARRAFQRVLELHPHQADAETALARLAAHDVARPMPTASP
ncbi:MAG TPA: hypothetical protein VGQ96_03725 [Candidatus Eremiobacteraceae bacterium]|nr:hypothetical protein [Candidatus Eremiobacteraceae bacterium]